YHGAGYFGSAFGPLSVNGDPSAADFKIEDITIPDAVGPERTARRRNMLQALDRWQKETEGSLGERSRFYQQAYDVITSPAAKKAFRAPQHAAGARPLAEGDGWHA